MGTIPPRPEKWQSLDVDTTGRYVVLEVGPDYAFMPHMEVRVVGPVPK